MPGSPRFLTERDIDQIGEDGFPLSIPKEYPGGQTVNDQTEDSSGGGPTSVLRVTSRTALAYSLALRIRRLVRTVYRTNR